MSTPQQLSSFNNQIPPRLTIKNLSSISPLANYTYNVTAADYGVVLENTNATSYDYTITLPSGFSLGVGFNFYVWNFGYGQIIINASNSEKFNNSVDTSYSFYSAGQAQVTWDGISWKITNLSPLSIISQAVAIGSNARVNNTGGVAVGYSVSSTGTYAAGLGYSITSSGTGSVALGYNLTASSNYATAIGSNSGGTGSQAVTSAGAMALGGSYASGIESFAAGIDNNTSTYGATGSTGPVAIGNNNKASGGYSTVVGGFSNIGSANWSMALGGRNCTAAYDYSIAYGYVGTPNAIGKVAFGHASGIGAGIGWGTLNLYRATTDATATILTSDNAAAGSTNQLVLPNNSAYTFSIMVVARQSATNGTASAAWKIEGLIRREGTAASTTLVNYITTVISNVPGWTIAVSADTTNGGLAITATGAAATNIRWVATAQTSEVTYA